MKILGWLSIGLVAGLMVLAAAVALPATVGAGRSGLTPLGGGSGPFSSEPAWNTGNMCTPTTGPGPTVTCNQRGDGVAYPLWYNFSALEVQHGFLNVNLYGSADCFNLNFHSFYWTINVTIYGSSEKCAPSPNPDAPATQGVNIVVNSEGDTFNVTQYGSHYDTNLTVYGASTQVNFLTTGSYDTNTVTYIGWSDETHTCPSGLVDGRVAMWTDTTTGSSNTFNTIFIDGTSNPHWVNFNYPYSTEPLFPPDGTATGQNDLYGNETTQTVPLGTCQYFGL